MVVAFAVQGKIDIVWLRATAYDHLYFVRFYVRCFSVTAYIKDKGVPADTSRDEDVNAFYLS